MINPQLLTKSSTFIIGPVATILGYVMNGIFFVLNKIGIPNIGLAIIIFTIVIYMCMMPLTIEQQKFSKLQSKMQPELQAIQKKYKGRTDNESAMKMNEETQAVYRKYGVSASGSCVQLLIQMPILFALYRVIYNFPAYVTQVRNAFFPLVDNLIASEGSAEYLQGTMAAAQFARQFTNDNFVGGVTTYVQNTYIDVLNRFSTADWSALTENFSGLAADITKTVSELNIYNNFIGLNIANSPWFTLQNAWKDKSVLLIILSVMIPALAAITQLINVALMPQAGSSSSGDAQQDSMAQSMKTMNYMMPIMSAWFCFTLPAGMGLYWIAGSVIRSVQQVFINKSIDKMDMDAYIKQQQEKQKKKAEKRGNRPTVSERMMEYASMNTKNMESQQAASRPSSVASAAGKKTDRPSTAYQNNKYKPGSLSAKANMVGAFNDNRKDKNDK